MSSEKLPDEMLEAIANGSHASAGDVRELAGELLAARRRLRGDSRTAEQVRKALAAVATANERLERVAAIVGDRDKEEAARW